MAIQVKTPASLAVTQIVIDVQPSLKDQQQLLAHRIGYFPFVYYRGLPIEEENIIYFKLESTTWLPLLNLTIRDWSSVMRSKMFPTDNEIISVYINSRESVLIDIKMDFKIVNFDYDPKTDLIYIVGWPNVDGLYLETNRSFKKMTSFDVVKTIASECKLGFATNIDNTKDVMTWINPGVIAEEFIIKTVHRAYLSDESFLWSFLDFNYNVNFIDVEVEMRSDASKQMGVTSFSAIGNEEGQRVEAVPMVFFFGRTVQGPSSNLDIIDYEVYNQSTFQSLAHGYRKEIEYYDRSGNWNNGRAGEFLTFTMDTNQNPQAAAENIVLKDTTDARNTNFFKSNRKFHWLGKFDISNAHLNYNYAIQHNRFNMEELQKVYCIITLAVPNYNLKRFMKIKIEIGDVPTPDSKNGLNERLSGAWLITGIIFEKSTEFVQKLILVRRELTAKNFNI